MQQTKDFNDFIFERKQYKVIVYKARSVPVMDLYFRGKRTTALRFTNGTVVILQNDKELTFTMDSIIKKSIAFLKTNFNFDWIDNLNVRKELRENYDEARS